MYFKEQAESRADALVEAMKEVQFKCNECGASSGDKLSAELSEANTTLAYLTELLDLYWSAHNPC
jgi:hypothetical protein